MSDCFRLYQDHDRRGVMLNPKLIRLQVSGRPQPLTKRLLWKEGGRTAVNSRVRRGCSGSLTRHGLDSARKLFISVAITRRGFPQLCSRRTYWTGSLNILLFSKGRQRCTDRETQGPFVWCKEKDPPFVLTSRHRCIIGCKVVACACCYSSIAVLQSMK